MDGAKLKEAFDTKWGMFRKLIAANPLKGFWIGVAAGSMLGSGGLHLLRLLNLLP